MNKNVLITCVGGLFFFDFLKCLKTQKRYNFKIIGTDNDPKAYGKVLVDKFYNSYQINSELKFFNYIKKIIKKEKIEIIIPLSDNEVRFFFKFKKKLLDLFPKLNFSFFENKNFDIFLSKNNFYNFCKNNNLDIGEFSIITNFNQLKEKIDKNKKYILKSTTDSGSKNVFLINEKKKKNK
jgi:glutathione synthase/RimK-type ligase-like ATP-grasp enzyme